MAPKVAPKAAAAKAKAVAAAPKAAAAKAKAVAAKAKAKAAAKAVARPIPVVEDRRVRHVEPLMPQVLFLMYLKQKHVEEPDYNRVTLTAVNEYLSNASWIRCQDALHKMFLFRPKLLRKVSKVWVEHADHARVRYGIRSSATLAVTSSGVVRAACERNA